jgi:hypothetical protein
MDSGWKAGKGRKTLRTAKVLLNSSRQQNGQPIDSNHGKGDPSRCLSGLRNVIDGEVVLAV